MFEPIGGCAPKYTGQNVVCPIAAIGAGADDDGDARRGRDGARASRTRIEKALASGKIKSLSAGKMGMSTSECGDLIAELASR